MIPDSLAGWSVEAVEHLLVNHYQENESFDFKIGLPHSSNSENKEHLRRTLAAFANGEGGFLVYGIDDNPALGKLRMKGLDPGEEFNRDFGHYATECEPTVPWISRDPPLRLPESGRLIHIVHVPKSWRAPHAVWAKSGKPEHGLVFPIRTSKGNEFMTYSAVQQMFLGKYEKRLKLQLLRGELTRISDEVWGLTGMTRDDEWRAFRPITHDLTTIESILGDTYSITISSPGFISAMQEVRRDVRRFNVDMEFMRDEMLRLKVWHLDNHKWGEWARNFFRGTAYQNALNLKNNVATAITSLDSLLA